MQTINQERVRELFDYRSDGELVWKVRRQRVQQGVVAGCINKEGYKVITVNGKTYPAHRLVWLWHHGVLPDKQLDHINRNKQDNKISNLRLVSVSENLCNRSLFKNNSTGVSGVSQNKSGRFIAQLSIDKKNVYLGSYSNLEDAIQARSKAERTHSIKKED